MITIKNILSYMESGKPFSLTLISYDRKRKKGGQKISYPEAILVQKEQKQTNRTLTKIEQQKQQLAKLKKNPNHRKWYTRNIRILQDGHHTSLIKCIHPPLIIEFNGEKVVP